MTDAEMFTALTVQIMKDCGFDMDESLEAAGFAVAHITPIVQKAFERGVMTAGQVIRQEIAMKELADVPKTVMFKA